MANKNNKDIIEDQMIHIHHDHSSWLKILDFHENEIDFFKKELQIVVNANASSMSVIEHVEEYREILERKLLTLRELQKEIKYQQKILTMDEILPDNIDYHLTMREKMDQFVNNYKTLKPLLRRFSSHSD